MQELIDEMNKRAAEPTSEEELKAIEPNMPPEHEWIDRRARVYGDRVHVWLEARGFLSVDEPGDPRAVIGWFHNGIASKIHRALYGRADDERRKRDGPADHDGSAKVALLGIERSHGAWLELAYCGYASPAEIEPFISDLIWLSDELERVFPRARAFVRPGLDEPDEVAKLLASEAAGLSGPRDC